MASDVARWRWLGVPYFRGQGVVSREDVDKVQCHVVDVRSDVYLGCAEAVQQVSSLATEFRGGVLV